MKVEGAVRKEKGGRGEKKERDKYEVRMEEGRRGGGEEEEGGEGEEERRITYKVERKARSD